jgi:hypothetical protein
VLQEQADCDGDRVEGCHEREREGGCLRVLIRVDAGLEQEPQILDRLPPYAYDDERRAPPIQVHVDQRGIPAEQGREHSHGARVDRSSNNLLV